MPEASKEADVAKDTKKDTGPQGDEAVKELSIIGKLYEPFPASVVRWKPQSLSNDKTRCMAVAYVPVDAYIDRLNDVLGHAWSSRVDLNASATRAIVAITLHLQNDITRTDVGETQDTKDANISTSATTQGFKRACRLFGLGLYLYKLPQTWVDYDSQRRRIKPGALTQLTSMLYTGQPIPIVEGGQPTKASVGGQKPGGKPPNGNGNMPNSPQAMLYAVNEKLEGKYRYESVKDLGEAVAAERGLEKMKWPAANDADGWKDVGNAAMASATKAIGG